MKTWLQYPEAPVTFSECVPEWATVASTAAVPEPWQSGYTGCHESGPSNVSVTPVAGGVCVPQPLTVRSAGAASLSPYVPCSPNCVEPPAGTEPFHARLVAVTALPDWFTVAFQALVTR